MINIDELVHNQATRIHQEEGYKRHLSDIEDQMLRNVNNALRRAIYMSDTFPTITPDRYERIVTTIQCGLRQIGLSDTLQAARDIADILLGLPQDGPYTQDGIIALTQVAKV